MQEGGLCLWDLAEAVAQDCLDPASKSRVSCQRPTYTTECHGTATMAGSIVAISVLPASPLPGKHTNNVCHTFYTRLQLTPLHLYLAQ